MGTTDAVRGAPGRGLTLVAGLVLAAAIMLGAQLPWAVLSGGPLAWLALAASAIVPVTGTVGAVLAWLLARVTRTWTTRRAAGLHLLAGLVVAALWLGLVVAVLGPVQEGRAAATAFGVYVVASAGFGAAYGRLGAERLAARPVLVTVLASVLVLLAGLGVTAW